ncbi:MAG TPA: ECF transporter S component [Anaerovoracaceae bacterium]|nr:ECF transporter S component [Anaerovoracaceae bacterium]
MIRQKFMTAILFLVMVPATVIGGIVFLDDRKYYFISLLLVIYAMIPFFMGFEGRKPKARELIVIAVLAAIAVAGRAAFFMIPQFKPVTALIIISGACFGGEVGFLVGSMTALISNLFFGMGPFTPWQMFSYGLIGYLAGILFFKGIFKTTKVFLCVFGGLASFFIYGGIMDLSSVLTFAGSLTWDLVVATYAAGLIFNLMHAASTVIFLLLLARPMLDKLERIKTKYGIITG